MFYSSIVFPSSEGIGKAVLRTRFDGEVAARCKHAFAPRRAELHHRPCGASGMSVRDWSGLMDTFPSQLPGLYGTFSPVVT